jgi:hypothetical protein
LKEYQEICGDLHKKLLQSLSELAQMRNQRLQDWWRLYNLTAVLLTGWQGIVLSNISHTCPSGNFETAVRILFGVFQYHTNRMKTSKGIEQVKFEAEQMKLRQRLPDMIGYGEKAV